MKDREADQPARSFPFKSFSTLLHRIAFFTLILFVVAFVVTIVFGPCRHSETDPYTVSREKITPGIEHLHMVQKEPASPQNIHLLLIDLCDPKVRFKTGLAGNTALTRQPVSAQAKRYGALVAVNGDFGAAIPGDDFPQGMTVQDGELITSPKYRTGLGITAGNRVYIGKWMPTKPPRWSWEATVAAVDGATHPIVHWNQACGEGWISVYSHRYSDPPRSPAERWSDAAEALLGADGSVIEFASPAMGFEIPDGGSVLVGRAAAAAWLEDHVKVGDSVQLNLKTTPDWRAYPTIAGGGPRLLKEGEFFPDPAQEFDGVTDAEDFELSYKTKYYETRHPRTLAGVTRDRRTLILAVVDGRAEGRSGMTLREAAELLKRFGAWDALQFDSGGSATMVLRGEVLNHPSDGRERPVTNSLLVFYDE